MWANKGQSAGMTVERQYYRLYVYSLQMWVWNVYKNCMCTAYKMLQKSELFSEDILLFFFLPIDKLYVPLLSGHKPLFLYLER